VIRIERDSQAVGMRVTRCNAYLAAMLSAIAEHLLLAYERDSKSDCFGCVVTHEFVATGRSERLGLE
jgi:hypothetical protein